MATLREDEQHELRREIGTCRANHDKLLRETDERVGAAEERLLRLEFEILGDQEMGRNSLRQDVNAKMNVTNGILMALLVATFAVIGLLVMDVIRAKPVNAQTTYEQHK